MSRKYYKKILLTLLPTVLLTGCIASGNPEVSSTSTMNSKVDNKPTILSREDWKAMPAKSKLVPPRHIVTTGKNRIVAENIMPLREKAEYITIHHVMRPAKKIALSENLKDFQKQMFAYSIRYESGVVKKIYLGDIPYHYFIDFDGNIGEGRELKYAAYSNTVYMLPIENHITIVLDGNFEKDEPTKGQIDSLTNMLEYLAKTHKIPLTNIRVHKEVANTSCPGANLSNLIPSIKIKLSKRGIK